jgi:5'-3' exoribonuclease 2
LFRWLSKKYPKIISPVIEEPDVVIDSVSYPADYSRPNPNGELDNLYLDMNGIVHPCSHPENRPPPATEDEMMLEVFKYTDRVVSMARPRKVLMIAVDGVAPRAKMNQQRSRRFRSARDAKDKDEQNARIVEEMEAKGNVIDDSIKEKRSWDTNVITPGTPFMDKLATAIRYWTVYKLNSDPGWKEVCCQGSCFDYLSVNYH